jgi:uncharacterized damage-inducible protein DinB
MNKQHTQLIDRLEASGAQVIKEFEKLSDEQVNQVPQNGEWSLHKAMAHLRDTEQQVFLYRVKLILNSDSPPQVQNFVQEEYFAEHYSPDEPRKKLVREFRKARRKLVKLLSDTKKKDWARYAIHPQYGNIPIEYVARHAYSHGVEHLAQFLVGQEMEILAAANPKSDDKVTG